jgi:hypothetical protein
LLTISGWSTAFWLTATTVPETGSKEFFIGFNRLNDAKGLSSLNGVANLGQLKVSHIAQFALGIISDSDNGSVAFNPNPLVGGE